MKEVLAGPLMGSGIKIGGVAIGGPSGRGDEEAQAEDQWGLREVGFLPKSDPNSAWNIIDGQGGPNTLVAVIDSGFDMTHPDGPQYIWTNEAEIPGNKRDDDGNGLIDDINGWNFLNNNTDLSDYRGHGTFVAGIIAAKANNGIGIAGIDPGAVILPLKVADAEGRTDSFHIFQAINYAVNKGARVLNISLGNREVSKLEQAAINHARNNGVFVTVAAGNLNEDIGKHGPASSLGAFAVGAMDMSGEKSTISNWGANNGLIAPGEAILSLRSKESFDPKKVSKDTEFYYAQSGTSFSTPIVAATASLLLAKDPNLTNTQIEDILHRSADDRHAKGWDYESGAGVLNATAALKQEQKVPVTVKVNQLRTNRDKNGKLESVDVFGTVRGDFQEYAIGVGKGANAGSFKEVAGPFKETAENAWITTIGKEHLRGSDDWLIQIDAKDAQGQSRTARSILRLNK